MIDPIFLYGAIAIMLIVIIKDFLKKKYDIDIDNLQLIETVNKPQSQNIPVITKGTGTHSLVLVDAGSNKATVMATLRQITGLDYNTAKNIVNSVPSEFMTEISDKEADLTKKALEFVGAKIEIK